MKKDPCSIRAEKLIERLSALRVHGEVVRKTARPSVEGVLQRTLVIRFKGRDIEKIVDEAEIAGLVVVWAIVTHFSGRIPAVLGQALQPVQGVGSQQGGHALPLHPQGV